jgi:predicted Zn-dependent protease with MMP-like domain
MRMSDAEFDSVVEEALDTLPEQFAELLDNIAVVVEQEPTEEDLELLEDELDDDVDDDEELDGDAPDDGDSGDELLGIYRGVPRTERSHDMMLLPDQIAIFRGPILRIAGNRREAVREIRDTVIHELGHYFGLSDDEMIY